MRVSDAVVRARREELARLLTQHQYLPLAEVCERLQVSEPTARRDLAVLEARHAITRTHGGARVEYNQKFPSFRDRLALASEAKARIAGAALKLLRPGMTVWLDGGTTLYAVAQRIAQRPPAGLVIVTNNLPAAELLADIDAIAVHLLGGQYFRRTSLLLGGGAPAAAKRWRFDLALLGLEGLTREGCWNSLEDVAVLQRAVLKVSRRKVVCADAAKIGRRAADFLCPPEAVDQLISDVSTPALRKAGIPLDNLLKGERTP